jgi:hypothetical protein
VRQPLHQRAKGFRIEIVHEVYARRLAQRADAGHAITGELRQRLAAQAGAACAEENDVGCIEHELAARLTRLHQALMAFRQAQQRQCTICVPPPQPVERGFSPIQRGLVCLGGNTVRADVLFEGAINRLLDGHGHSSGVMSRTKQDNNEWEDSELLAESYTAGKSGSPTNAPPNRRFRSR